MNSSNNTNNTSKKKIFIVAGEASGDLHASKLIQEMKKQTPNIEIVGIGGDKMIEAGARILIHQSKIAVMGVVEIAACIKHIRYALKVSKDYLSNNKPDLLILIDYPGFNLILAKYAHKLGIPVFYYICPQIWAWRKGRVKKLKRYVTKAAVILPFEEKFLKTHGIDATFVGHPLLDVVTMEDNAIKKLTQANIDIKKRIITLLPGSRYGEVKRIFPNLVKSIDIIRQELSDTEAVVGLAPSIDKNFLIDIIKKVDIKLLQYIKFYNGNIYNLIGCSELVLAASGTVTLEAAILEAPLIVVYILNSVSYILARLLVDVPYVSLVNLVANKKIVPELLQKEANSLNIAKYAIDLLKNKNKISTMRQELKQVKELLGSKGAAKRAAQIALSMI